MKKATKLDTRGTDMFARYAYAPNALGYCGPSGPTTLLGGSPERIEAMAKQFSGAWPYLQVLSRLTGITDPLDYRLVESYWLGGGIGADLDSHAFTAELLSVIGPQAGHYWTHLSLGLAREAAANHCFHVFGVYPWSRLLGKGMDEGPLSVLDNCRISWGTLLSVDSTSAVVLRSQLTWDGRELDMTSPSAQSVEVDTALEVGPHALALDRHVAMHWGRICGTLTRSQVDRLSQCTYRQIQVTNRRMAS